MKSKIGKILLVLSVFIYFSLGASFVSASTPPIISISSDKYQIGNNGLQPPFNVNVNILGDNLTSVYLFNIQDFENNSPVLYAIQYDTQNPNLPNNHFNFNYSWNATYYTLGNDYVTVVETYRPPFGDVFFIQAFFRKNTTSNTESVVAAFDKQNMSLQLLAVPDSNTTPIYMSRSLFNTLIQNISNLNLTYEELAANFSIKPGVSTIKGELFFYNNFNPGFNTSNSINTSKIVFTGGPDNNYNIRLGQTPAPDGSYDIIAGASNNAGNSNQSKITLQIISFNVIAPEEGKIYGERKVPITVIADGSVNYIARALNSNSFTKVCTKCSNYTSSMSAREGPNQLLVNVLDLNNVLHQRTVDFFVDSIPPTISSISVNGKTAKNGTYVNGTVNFSVSYTENNLKNITFIYGTNSFNQHLLNNCPAGRSKKCSLILDLAPYNGQNVTYYFVVNDSVHSTISRKYSLSVDTTAPKITINSPLNQTYSTSSVRIDLKVSEKVNTLKMSVNGGSYSLLCSNCDSYNATRSFSSGKSYNVTFQGTDKAGNVGYASVDFTRPSTTTTTTYPNLSIITPYVNENDVSSINEAYSNSTNAPWGFKHNGIDFTTSTDLIPFRAVTEGTIFNLNTSKENEQQGWHTGLCIDHNPYIVCYNFETFSPDSAIGDKQSANIQVKNGDKVKQGDIIGKLVHGGDGAHIHFGVIPYQGADQICPEPYFTEDAKASIMRIIHKDHPDWLMCYS